MRPRFVAPLVALVTVGATIFTFSGVASAHHPEIAAEAVCDLGQAAIRYTSVSWDTGIAGENDRIDILFDGVVVGTGAYARPDNAFSGSAPVPAGKGAGDSVTVTALAVGAWGNGASGGQSTQTVVTIPADGCTVDPAFGRFTGGGHQIRVGAARVTRGFTIHCDLKLSNNLEINWGGNQFHMTEHLTTVACTDDPAIVQAPPPAPVDTIVGIGTGRYNGTDGYTIEFTLVDAGEPGTADMAALRVYRTSAPADVVLDVPLRLITGGNVQAHYDQPHK